PAHCTAVGKVLLAYDAKAATAALQTPLIGLTPRSICDPDTLAVELTRVRRGTSHGAVGSAIGGDVGIRPPRNGHAPSDCVPAAGMRVCVTGPVTVHGGSDCLVTHPAPAEGLCSRPKQARRQTISIQHLGRRRQPRAENRPFPPPEPYRPGRPTRRKLLGGTADQL